MEAKDRETYDMKHDLIAAEIQAGDLKKELEKQKEAQKPSKSHNNKVSKQTN